ncbi:MAG: NAD(P)-dependent glycerol-3-phosphate dehydrogenase [Methylobacteriaceae bacterium]|nr:NAD(P)-dependent glycerol-3-phosphate dehydrogenase [Methylobacteriaceae bacterium]
MEPCGVIGGGAWGTALAAVMAAKGHHVIHWMRDAGLVQDLRETGENRRYLPGVRLPSAIEPTTDAAGLFACRIVFVVVPTQALRPVLNELRPNLADAATLILCAKGIERKSGMLPSRVVRDILPAQRLAVLSGPSFAADVVRGLPTAVTLAAADAEHARELAQVISGRSFRVYHGSDVTGVEIGGAAKNVYAIGCGALVGKGLGESAKAALMARCFAELLRFADRFGARPETLMGLSGLGDLLLTCSSEHSRNFSTGLALGRNTDVSDPSGGRLAEGVFTAPVLVKLAREHDIDLPIARAVDALLSRSSTLDDVIDTLLSRPLRAEHERTVQG